MSQYTIDFQCIRDLVGQEQVGCYAIGIFEDALTLENDPWIGEDLQRHVIRPLLQESGFTGKQYTTAVANCFHPLHKVILVGLGKREALSQETIRQASGIMYRESSKLLYTAAVMVHFPTLFHHQSYLQALVEGILLAAHRDERFKSQKNTATVFWEKVYLLDAIEDKAATAAIELAKKIASGVIFARIMAHAPANYMTPTTLAQTAGILAEKYDLDLRILEKADCLQLGMGAYLSVSQGSDTPPKFIHLSYKPESLDPRSPYQKIALIGKGVTFDSGGLNLKTGTAQQIELMKYDMSGAAAILGVAEIVGKIKPAKEIHFIIAATENMINGSATKPGDVVTASNGKTIEVDNTDAEGRLTLADALVYAEQLGVDTIIDLATLTGAIVVALGEKMAGLFSNDQQLANSLLATVSRTGEKIWQMPLEEAYFEEMQSNIADMRNSGSRQGGGAITAAVFLKQFVQKPSWAHIDIAGSSRTKKVWSYYSEGATGFGVRLLVDWILHH